MTEIPTQDQIDKFWRRFGTRRKQVTLNNLYKHVIPRLGCKLTIHTNPQLTPLHTVEVRPSKDADKVWLKIEDEDAAHAIFWAINRFITAPVLWCYEPIKHQRK